MRLLENWVETPLAAALGWTLLHSLWEVALIAAALAAALVMVRSARARYALACVAMLVMLGAFGVTFVHVMPERGHSLTTASPPAFPAGNVRADANAQGDSHPDLAAVAPWLAPFWLAGVWIFYLGQAASWISVRRLRRRGVCCAPDRLQNELARLSARLRVARPVRLLESCLADAPMVLGHFRPLILMPVGLLTGLPAGQIEAILLHELAHIRRCDYLVNALQRAVEGLLFYHPAVWWVSRVIRDEREHCCDDLVVATSGNAREYAFALAALEQNRSCREPAVAATGGNLMRRIHRLLYPKRANRAWAPWFAFVLLMASAALAVTAWQAGAAPQNSAAEQAEAERAEAERKALNASAAAQPKLEAERAEAASKAFSKWLNQEAVYIITDQERAAFLQLKTNEEREKFVGQFWLRRDPTPGTPENEFKTEHYRRIAYANAHFGTTSGTPGWQTDRGHIYIVYGPPDELEAHPTGAQKQYPRQDWLYHHVEGVGDTLFIRFIDRTGTGDYRLAPGNPW